MSLPALREILARLNVSTQALAALGAAMDAHASGVELDPAMRPYLDEVMAALGARDIFEGVTPAELRPMIAEIRFTMIHGSKLLFAASRPRGWAHADPDLLRAAGETSAGFAFGLKNAVAPQLEGLSERLAAPGAAFLDVGVGIAGLAVAMARVWPSLRVVGIDPWAPSIAIARDNVRAAGLEERIELREESVEVLEERDVYDLAWLPAPFFPEAVVAPALVRVHRAIRLGGWILIALANSGTDPLLASLVRFRVAQWGGRPFAPAEVETLLADAGFVGVRTLPIAPGSPAIVIAAQRAPSA